MQTSLPKKEILFLFPWIFRRFSADYPQIPPKIREDVFIFSAGNPRNKNRTFFGFEVGTLDKMKWF